MNGILSVAVHDWMARANCVGEDPDRMQPEFTSRAALEETKAEVCGFCPVRRQCLEFGKSQDEAYGLHGGEWLGEEPTYSDRTCESCEKTFHRKTPSSSQKFCVPCGKRIQKEKTKARNAARRSREKVSA